MCLDPHLNLEWGWRCETGLSAQVKYFTDVSKAVLLLWIICVIYVLCLSCFRVCLLLPCGHLLGKGWRCDSCLWCSIVVLLLSYVVSWVRCGLDCIVSWSFPSFLLRYTYFTGQICAVVAAVVKTQRVFSSHCGFLACVKLESLFNKSAEKMLIYKKDSLISYTLWWHRVLNTGRLSWCNIMLRNV